MPFTLAHPAAAVPLCRPMGRYGVLSALVIGSLVPDIWYLAPEFVSRNDSHGIAGLFWFCVPAGLALYLLYYHALKRPLIALLPFRLAGRLASDARLPAKPLPAVLLSLLAGSMTHNVWDSFTHPQGRAARVLSWLGAPLFSVGHLELYGATLLQYASGVLGLGLIGWWSLRARTACVPFNGQPGPALAPGTRAWILSALLAASLAGMAVKLAMLAQGEPLDFRTIRATLRPALQSGLKMLAVAVAFYAALWWLWTVRSGGARGH